MIRDTRMRYRRLKTGTESSAITALSNMNAKGWSIG
jgi:hypothetical protein